MSEPTRLITMRLADMFKVHPEQVTRECALCGEPVGVYPSGQKALREHPTVEIICQVCAEKIVNVQRDIATPVAPIDEIFQEIRDSVRRS
jgi:hypothetical protein